MKFKNLAAILAISAIWAGLEGGIHPFLSPKSAFRLDFAGLCGVSAVNFM